jgi:hypothetical protein
MSERDKKESSDAYPKLLDFSNAPWWVRLLYFYAMMPGVSAKNQSSFGKSEEGGELARNPFDQNITVRVDPFHIPYEFDTKLRQKSDGKVYAQTTGVKFFDKVLSELPQVTDDFIGKRINFDKDCDDIPLKEKKEKREEIVKQIQTLRRTPEDQRIVDLVLMNSGFNINVTRNIKLDKEYDARSNVFTIRLDENINPNPASYEGEGLAIYKDLRDKDMQSTLRGGFSSAFYRLRSYFMEQNLSSSQLSTVKPIEANAMQNALEVGYERILKLGQLIERRKVGKQTKADEDKIAKYEKIVQDYYSPVFHRIKGTRFTDEQIDILTKTIDSLHSLELRSSNTFNGKNYEYSLHAKFYESEPNPPKTGKSACDCPSFCPSSNLLKIKSI